jgi:hypothetical protein
MNLRSGTWLYLMCGCTLAFGGSGCSGTKKASSADAAISTDGPLEAGGAANGGVSGTGGGLVDGSDTGGSSSSGTLGTGGVASTGGIQATGGLVGSRRAERAVVPRVAPAREAWPEAVAVAAAESVAAQAARPAWSLARRCNRRARVPAPGPTATRVSVRGVKARDRSAGRAAPAIAVLGSSPNRPPTARALRPPVQAMSRRSLPVAPTPRSSASTGEHSAVARPAEAPVHWEILLPSAKGNRWARRSGIAPPRMRCPRSVPPPSRIAGRPATCPRRSAVRPTAAAA